MISWFQSRHPFISKIALQPNGMAHGRDAAGGAVRWSRCWVASFGNQPFFRFFNILKQSSALPVIQSNCLEKVEIIQPVFHNNCPFEPLSGQTE